MYRPQCIPICISARSFNRLWCRALVHSVATLVFLPVIPLTHYSDIVSDIPSGSIYIYMAYMHIFWVGRKEVLTLPTTITRHHWAYQDFFGDAVAPQSLHCALRHLHGKHPCNKGHFFNWQYGQGRFDSSLGSVWTTSSK